MTYPRKSLLSLEATPYYHVVARCVRRAWLWGVDEYAGRDYSHRKTWVIERLKTLSGVFAIDICAYAVMSNHYHLVLHVDQSRSRQWTQQEVIDRWTRLFSAPPLITEWREGKCSKASSAVASRTIEEWRHRLSDVSWYMRCLNEHLARRANREDGCTGRFWEGRFKSQALLDEAGLLTAMAYVDLNPVRAGICGTPEASEFTSIRERLDSLRAAKASIRSKRDDVPLLPFRSTLPTRTERTPSIPLSLPDYLELLDSTARIPRRRKRGAPTMSVPPLLGRLGINQERWRQLMRSHGNPFGRALGRVEQLRRYATQLGQSWVRGARQAEQLYLGTHGAN